MAISVVTPGNGTMAASLGTAGGTDVKHGQTATARRYVHELTVFGQGHCHPMRVKYPSPLGCMGIGDVDDV